MRHGVVSSTCFQLGEVTFYIDLQDMSYYGERAIKYYVPSCLISDDWGIAFTKQFRTEQACKNYIIKCVKRTCKQILKETT